jgi:hypothetical protein
MTMPNKKTSKKNKVILIILGFLLLSLIAFFGYKVLYRKSSPATITDGQQVNLNPPTETEKAETEAHKDQLVKDEQARNSQTPSSTKKQVTIVITEASATSVRAYANDVFEDGGVCTATVTKAGSSVTKSSSGFENVSYTQCAPINWDTPLSKGAWTLVVTYKSAAAEGTQSKTLEVQ